MPVHLQPFYKNMGFKAGYCPNAENYSKECLSIPVFYNLKRKELKKISDLFHKFFSK